MGINKQTDFLTRKKMAGARVIQIVAMVCAMGTLASSSCAGDYCYPGDAMCWPKIQEELDFVSSLDGKIVAPVDEIYGNLTMMINTRVTKYPYAIVIAKSINDVIRTVKFANRYNVKLSVRSSGHDYIGRSTGDGTLQINLAYMTDLQFNLNSSRHAAGELTAQSGNSWIHVYEEASKVGRVIVGGSAHTVSMGGYTLGGGHSPIVRKFGLAVDNLLEVEMVTANGSLVYANASMTRYVDPDTGATLMTSANTDIFWAVRGGGGGTFGIVTAFTYKLHMDSKMVVIDCYSPMQDAQGNNIDRAYLKSFNNLLSTSLAPEWGGYEIFIPFGDPARKTKGASMLHLNHFGEWGSASFNTLLPFLNAMNLYCYSYKNVSNFLDYEITANDALYTSSYVLNTFMQPDSFTDAFYDWMTDLLLGDHGLDVGFGCTGSLIGGNSKNVAADATAVTPNFRTGVMSLSCGVFPGESLDGSIMDAWVAIGERMSQQLLKFGNGTYFNEPSAYLPNWKTDYWGGHYDKLLAIKQAWDPENVFTCLHCVGSDVKELASGSGTGVGPHIPNPVIIG